jgi:hypothetical protein
MDWKIFHEWNSFLLQLKYKDNIIDKTIREFNRVLSDQSNNIYKNSKQIEDKNNISKNNWQMYGKINNLLDKIQKIIINNSELKSDVEKFKLNFLMLPRLCCNTTQKYHKLNDIKEGKMYNISAEYNGVDTENKDTYFYIPIHKTRRHIHGVPNEFLLDYIYNMIETAIWEKNNYLYYIELNNYKNCAFYQCPEKYKIKNENEIKEIACTKKVSVLTKITELKKYLKKNEFNKIRIFFEKKRIDNFRLNFPNKSRWITYCPGNGINSCYNYNGLIHYGIPSVKQSCYWCEITYCRECGVKPYHENKLCNPIDLQNVTDIMLENPDNYRKCPGCNIWIEKENGCDHMKCICGVHFCYTCRNVLCANDPYYHICNMEGADPHYRDYAINDDHVKYSGEISCKCIYCIDNTKVFPVSIL